MFGVFVLVEHVIFVHDVFVYFMLCFGVVREY
jgi:hypothetical protein